MTEQIQQAATYLAFATAALTIIATVDLIFGDAKGKKR